MEPRNWKKRALKIRMLLLDVDGILTDGRIVYAGEREEVKSFDVKDGQGIKLLQEAGIGVGILSSRRSTAVTRRARELGIRPVNQGVSDKARGLETIAKRMGLSPEEIAYMGDDWADLPVFRRAGLSIAVADSIRELRQRAHLVTASSGGRGAVREACEAILKAQGNWSRVVKRYRK